MGMMILEDTIGTQATSGITDNYNYVDRPMVF